MLFIAHTLSQVREKCNLMSLLDGGKIRIAGKIEDVCNSYFFWSVEKGCEYSWQYQ